MSTTNFINAGKLTKFILVAFMFFLAINLNGCEKTDSRENINSLEKKVDSLKIEVSELKRIVDSIELNDKFRKFAYLTPGSDGYSLIQTDIATLTASLTDVKPYANGSKVTLVLGNTSSARIDGLKAVIDWGTVDDKGIPDNTNAKSKEIQFEKSLAGGNWTRLEIVLEGIQPTSLGFIRIRDVTHRGIGLFGLGK